MRPPRLMRLHQQLFGDEIEQRGHAEGQKRNLEEGKEGKEGWTPRKRGRGGGG
jgi:hypothetical protein